MTPPLSRKARLARSAALTLALTGNLALAQTVAPTVRPAPALDSAAPGGSDAAQTPRLTSLGQRLSWVVGDQTLDLHVARAGRVTLELYSPGFDPQDYRSADSYGDERYGGADPETTFTLLAADGAVLAERRYPAGAHDWQGLIDQILSAGHYRLAVSTSGLGKNSFAVRLAADEASLSAARMNVNVRSAEWMPALELDAQAGQTLRLYDGDGPAELEARLRDDQGGVIPLAVSGPLAWADWTLPAGGHFRVELRQPAGARQYSNTVGFELVQGTGRLPILLARADTLGTLRLRAEGLTGETLQVRVGGQTVNLSAVSELRLPAGRYPLSVGALPGTTLQAPAEVEVRRGEVSEAPVVARREALALRLERVDGGGQALPDRTVCLNDTVTLRATALGTGRADLKVELPAGLEAMGPTEVISESRADAPAELLVQARATQAGPQPVSARVGGARATLSLNTLSGTGALDLSREPLGEVQPGQTFRVGLTVLNTGDVPADYRLTDDPGELLEALEPTVFAGTLAPGESRALSYRAHVRPDASALSGELRAVLSGQCGPEVSLDSDLKVGVLTTAPDVANVAAPPFPAPVPAAPAPTAQRHSTVRISVQTPASAQSLLVAQQLPAGATYLAGSSRLSGTGAGNETALAEPTVGPSGTLYWTLDGTAPLTGVLSYELSHTGPLVATAAPALLALYPQGRTQLLSGTLDTADRAAARPLGSAGPRENAGQIRLPLNGTVYRDRDQVTVVVEGPADQPLETRLNGELLPDTLIGRRSVDSQSGLARVEYVGVRLSAGENVLGAGLSRIRLVLAGTTSAVLVQPLQMVADGVTPIQLRVRAVDERGVSTALPFVTLRSVPEPTVADANPREAGYQLRLVDGEGVLTLPPQTTPGTVSVETDLGDGAPQRHRLALTPGRARVGVGLLSVTVGPVDPFSSTPSPFGVSVTGRASLETPLGRGRLVVAADSSGLPTSRDTTPGYPLYGDRSSEQTMLQGQDPVAFQYDHPDFTLAYRQGAVPIQTVTVPVSPTALSVVSRPGDAPFPVTASAFATLLPLNSREELITPDGTRLIRLRGGGIAPDSETVEVLTTDFITHAVSARRLARGADYVLDAVDGLLSLATPLSRIDRELNTVQLRVAYRLDGDGERVLAGGAELRAGSGPLSGSVALVQLPGQLTAAARVNYDTQPFHATLLTAYSGGLLLDATARATLGSTTGTFGLHHQSAGYAGLNAGGAGTYANAALSTALTDSLRATASADYRAAAEGAGQDPGGSLAAGLVYSNRPFTVGAGLRAALGNRSGLSATALLGYHAAPIDLEVSHDQPLSGGALPTTTFSARLALGGGVAAVARDEVRWGQGHRASVGLESRRGATNYAAAYELPTADGAGNRARFGADTTLSLNPRTGLALSGAYLYSLGQGQGELNTSATLRYQSDSASASASADFSVKDGVLRTVLRGGAALSLNDTLTVNADALSEFGPLRGDRFSVGAALRNSEWQGLATLRYSSGSLADGAPSLLGQTDLEYHQPDYALRAGLAARARLNDASSLTWQPSLGATYYPTPRLGLGARLQASLQPGTGINRYGLGLEGSVRALPGAWITLGYNVLGFDSVTSAMTRPGAYLRLDLVLDEQPNTSGK
ncbi:DUF11 domain-containing protein [Deinococcus koreensis]|uniref:DUF11 domain-containing protein n=1 Tax=Deinococcus koreensis TaxID=2054903 RepID=A0A2K3USL4_9DEIO|nr:DUF11 domain-containing protein [Deinococcus koreensis]PNY79535.1 DUF11 domain-containing protein [Deinococcus koreensis]